MAVYRYWQHFLGLEDDLTKTSRYVAFDNNNENAFSVAFTKLLLAACSELDGDRCPLQHHLRKDG